MQMQLAGRRFGKPFGNFKLTFNGFRLQNEPKIHKPSKEKAMYIFMNSLRGLNLNLKINKKLPKPEIVLT